MLAAAGQLLSKALIGVYRRVPALASRSIAGLEKQAAGIGRVGQQAAGITIPRAAGQTLGAAARDVEKSPKWLGQIQSLVNRLPQALRPMQQASQGGTSPFAAGQSAGGSAGPASTGNMLANAFRAAFRRQPSQPGGGGIQYSNKTPGQVAGNAVVGAGANIAMGAGLGFLTGGPVGAIIGASAALATSFIGLAFIGKRLGDALLESQKRLINFNGVVAAAYANLERGEVKRAIESGARRGKTITALAEATNKYEDTMQPIRDFTANIGNTIGAAVTGIFAKILGPVSRVADYLNELVFGKGKLDPGDWHTTFRQRAAERRVRTNPLPKLRP